MRIYLPILFSFSIVVPETSFAILDFVGQAAKDAAKSAAYVDAVGELANELTDSSEVSEGARALNERMTKIKTETQNVYFVSTEFKSLLEGPDWSSRQLDQNIRYTSRYVSRLKKLLVTLGMVGTDVATAMNTAETNGALKEVLKNQQAQLLMQKEDKVERMESEMNEKKTWDEFISNERSTRSGEIRK